MSSESQTAVTQQTAAEPAMGTKGNSCSKATTEAQMGRERGASIMCRADAVNTINRGLVGKKEKWLSPKEKIEK